MALQTWVGVNKRGSGMDPIPIYDNIYHGVFKPLILTCQLFIPTLFVRVSVLGKFVAKYILGVFHVEMLSKARQCNPRKTNVITLLCSNFSIYNLSMCNRREDIRQTSCKHNLQFPPIYLFHPLVSIPSIPLLITLKRLDSRDGKIISSDW